ncbi:hypothetical protein J8281_10085 [Aquimarina sp. U1-2]|uniref:hypothetical protein n=1 Tax=Aquimarina sp. U1-2 TaxID=2823141 RepID=UPI001AEC819A|nr:hypothetical protein [Aquimarina sp. U1-2]MBP2832533.1 hypothetical protein [Aquimarina sp. U1-2]
MKRDLFMGEKFMLIKEQVEESPSLSAVAQINIKNRLHSYEDGYYNRLKTKQ